DERSVVGGGQVVALQAQPDRVTDRICRHRQHENRRGCNQRERQSLFWRQFSGAGLNQGGGHGNRPFPSTAFCTWVVSSSAVRSGSISVMGLSTDASRIATA